MKNFKLNKVYLFFTALFAFMMHIPVAFSHNKAHVQSKAFIPKILPNIAIDSTNFVKNVSSKLYDSLKLNFYGLSEDAFQYALKGFEYLKEKGKIANDHIISIVDFSKPSSQKRLFVLDLDNYKILFNTYVAHGQGSGELMATKFSNTPESYQSSLGFYTTSSTYIGKNGYSLHLHGLEYGINDKADERAIVMHGAPYVSETFVQSQGHIGRSWGCPAVPEKISKPIIEKIKNGSCLFIYSENEKYLHQSRILNS
jgi:hypothetical protein